MPNTPALQALFRRVGADGVDWLFVVQSDEGWAITQNGTDMYVGNRSTVTGGVGKFMALSGVTVASHSAHDAVVRGLLDRIERDRLSARRVAKSDRRTRARAPKGMSGCFST